MATDLVTGSAGFEHIDGEKWGALNAAIIGSGEYVLEGGSQFAATLISANEIHIGSGDVSMQGRHFHTDEEGETINITSGTQGENRNTVICLCYKKEGDIETYEWIAKDGETASSTAATEIIKGDILAGADYNEMPMYRVVLDGVNVSPTIIPLFTKGQSQKDAWDSLSQVRYEDTILSLGSTADFTAVSATIAMAKVGAIKICQIYVAFTSAKRLLPGDVTNDTICTLKPEFMPVFTQSLTSNSTGPLVACAVYGANGEIRIASTATGVDAGQRCTVSGMYLCA